MKNLGSNATHRKTLADLMKRRKNQMRCEAKGCILAILLLFSGLNVAIADPLFDYSYLVEAWNTDPFNEEWAFGTVKIGYEDAYYFSIPPDDNSIHRATFDVFCGGEFSWTCYEPTVADTSNLGSQVTLLSIEELPESSSLSLLSAGVAGMLVFYWRRKRGNIFLPA